MDDQPQIEIPRSELVPRLKSLISDAKSTPIEELCKRGDYGNQPNLKYPQTKGEKIVDEALSLLLSQDWVDNDPILDEAISILGQLDMDASKSIEWQALFKLDKLIKLVSQNHV